MNALEPCPFCGGTDITLSAWDVQCGGCGALVLPEKGSYHEVGAIAAWNRRAATTGRETREAPTLDLKAITAAQNAFYGIHSDIRQTEVIDRRIVEALIAYELGRALASNGDGDE